MIAVERPELVSRAVMSEVKVADPASLIAAFGGLPIAALESRNGDFAVGIGEAFVVEAYGPDRFDAIRQKAARVFSTIGHRGRPLRMFGGFAFEETDARFVLPRWLYEVSGPRVQAKRAASEASEGGSEGLPERVPRARLTLTLRGDEDPHQIELERQRIMAALENPPAIEPSFSAAEGVLVPTRIARLGDYAGAVSQALEQIAAGALDKVVLARRIRVEAEKPYRIAPVLAGFGRNERAVRFAFGRDGSFFAGATPELLVARAGAEVRSAALAGSARPEAASELFGSAKDRAEHGHVARFVKSTLERFANQVSVSDHQLSLLSHVAHLITPIAAQLARPVHVLELAGALHPTPAVGGVPQDLARDFIRAVEKEPRGWYAGPVGWFDAEGDGELFVALRSARFEGELCDLFVGAGIVSGSDPQAEVRETELKAKTVMTALGVR
jgi:menaquinone-specific isochorismate synthase